MMKMWLCMVLFASSQLQALTRFDKIEIQFQLLEQDLPPVKCTHVPLKDRSPEAPDLPWWWVECDKRSYVVDVWYEESPDGERKKSIRLMYHVKESADSSGQKNTQFKTHVTDMIVTEGTLVGFRSFLDVRNGTADLLFEGFKKSD